MRKEGGRVISLASKVESEFYQKILGWGGVENWEEEFDGIESWLITKMDLNISGC